ncbi:MAG: sulfurtransferase TusA family protein [Ardenticatenales bacterium]|jgi:TusA-related sulfurtransferase|nr:sulfurtransferase TusA family protein [Ardenticatenales bacterium]MCC7018731.1 sulfurtransferase TusA family protein [Ardenticatenales bacterium]
MSTHFDATLDVKGAKCPMPLVKSRKAIGDLPVGHVLQVIATDRGSIADFQGWATTAKNIRLVAQETTAEGGQDLYVHYLERTA